MPQSNWLMKYPGTLGSAELYPAPAFDSREAPCDLCLKKLSLCQSQEARALLSHPFGAWLLLFLTLLPLLPRERPLSATSSESKISQVQPREQISASFMRWGLFGLVKM